MQTIHLAWFFEPLSSISHLLTAFAALIGIGFLLSRGRGNLTRQLALFIFSFSLIYLFSMSGVYHLLDRPSVASDVLQRLDHAGIWCLIAGSFTPLHIILFRGFWRWIPLLVIWTVAITGLVLEIVFFESIPEWLTLILYLSLGWFGLATTLKFRNQYQDKSVGLLCAGGLLYSVGAVIDYFRWPVLWSGVLGPHEIFHLFVTAAATTHWYFIYRWADHPIDNRIVFHVQIFPDQRYHAKAVGENISVEACSLEELKTQAAQKVKARFHQSIKPNIHLKYFHEEVL